MTKNKFNYAVIIPHFTRDGNVDMLKRAVNSIPERDDIQVIVIDNSIYPISEYLFINRSNVIIIFSSNSRYAGGARNEGMDHSNAKWLIFLDSDDFFSPNAFEIFDEYVYSNTDIIFFSSQGVYSDNIKKKSDRCDRYTNQVKRFIQSNDQTGIRLQFQVPWSKMIRSMFVLENKIRFDEVPICNDDIFSLRTGLLAKTINADLRVVYYATVSRGSLTKTVSLESIQSHIEVYQRRNKLLKENGYKKDASVMYYVLQSIQYGIKPFIKFLKMTIEEGDLLVGCSNWIITIMRQFKRSKRNENKKYRVKK